MNILIACEESQAVCKAFREKGISAYSCDLLPCSGGHPEWHIQSDLSTVLKAGMGFITQAGTKVFISKWDAIIGFPPCTYLSNAGAVRLYPKKGELNIDRYNKGLKAKEFFMSIYNADCDFIAIENPIPSTIYALPHKTQAIQPYQFGHPFSKKTYLWLKGFPKLEPTKLITENVISWVSGGSKDHNGNPRKNKGTTIRDSVRRSKTFSGIAEAMAEQWSKVL